MCRGTWEQYDISYNVKSYCICFERGKGTRTRFIMESTLFAFKHYTLYITDIYINQWFVKNIDILYSCRFVYSIQFNRLIAQC